jgi:hypothetical protein
MIHLSLSLARARAPYSYDAAVDYTWTGLYVRYYTVQYNALYLSLVSESWSGLLWMPIDPCWPPGVALQTMAGWLVGAHTQAAYYYSCPVLVCPGLSGLFRDPGSWMLNPCSLTGFFVQLWLALAGVAEISASSQSTLWRPSGRLSQPPTEIWKAGFSPATTKIITNGRKEQHRLEFPTPAILRSLHQAKDAPSLPEILHLAQRHPYAGAFLPQR